MEGGRTFVAFANVSFVSVMDMMQSLEKVVPVELMFLGCITTIGMEVREVPPLFKVSFIGDGLICGKGLSIVLVHVFSGLFCIC